MSGELYNSLKYQFLFTLQYIKKAQIAAFNYLTTVASNSTFKVSKRYFTSR